MNVEPLSYAPLALMLTAGFLFGVVLEKVRLTPAIGYLLAGVVMGLILPIPKELVNTLDLLSEISILFLFFEIGTEIHISRTSYLRGPPLYITLLEMSLAMPAMLGISLAFGLSVRDSIIAGLIASFSSTVFTFQLLKEMMPGDRVYRTVLMVAAVEDIVIVLALAMLRGSPQPLYVLAAEVVGITVVLFFISRELTLKVISRFIRQDETGLILIISYCLVMGMLTGYLGVGPALGAFIAGLTFTALPSAHDLMRMFRPVRALFLTLFFASIGLTISSISLTLNALWIAVALAAVTWVVHTLTAVTSSALVGGLGLREGVETGLYLSTVSELSLVIAYYAASSGSSPILLYSSSIAVVIGAVGASYLVKARPGVMKVLNTLLRGVGEAFKRPRPKRKEVH